MVVEAKEAVPWTKPDDLTFDPTAARLALRCRLAASGRLQRRDGRRLGPVHRELRSTANVFRALITRNGGEVVDHDAIPGPSPRRRTGLAGEQVLHVDPEKIPRADELSPLLLPGVARRSTSTTRGPPRVCASRSPASARRPPAACWSRCCCRRCSRPARRPAVPSASTTSSRSAWRCTTTTSANNAFPGPAITDKDGKPLLSWRVAILPYIEQQGLYKKFKLDEPWDSPHNKALFKEMPPIYVCPSRADGRAGHDDLPGVRGQGRSVRERQGHEARRRSPTGRPTRSWSSRPRRRFPGPSPTTCRSTRRRLRSLFGAGSSHPGGFNAFLADGSVRFIRNTISLEAFRALITRTGAKVVTLPIRMRRN